MWVSLTAACLKFCSQLSETVYYVSVVFILSYTLSFCNYHRPNYGFSWGSYCCKPITQHLVQLH